MQKLLFSKSTVVYKMGLISVLVIRGKVTEKAKVMPPLVMRFTLPGEGCQAKLEQVTLTF